MGTGAIPPSYIVKDCPSIYIVLLPELNMKSVHN